MNCGLDNEDDQALEPSRKSDGSGMLDSSVNKAAGRKSCDFDWFVRVPALILFVGSTGLLIVAATLSPTADGYGTHTQLGMDRCGFAAQTGLPCATCGMTTAFAHAADGNVLASFTTQPAGAVFAIGTAMVSLISGYTLVMGISLVPIGRFCWRPKVIIGLIVLVLVAWGYKMLVWQGA
jgi:hypothetical protein